jgi:hypothetical protein
VAAGLSKRRKAGQSGPAFTSITALKEANIQTGKVGDEGIGADLEKGELVLAASYVG